MTAYLFTFRAPASYARGCPMLGAGGAVEVAELAGHGEMFDEWLARH